VTASKRHHVVGCFAEHRDAEDAVFRLGEAGFLVHDVSIVARGFASERWLRGADDDDPHAPAAWTGGVLGMLVGAAFLWIPGAGPIAVTGRLASMIMAASAPSSELGRALEQLGVAAGQRGAGFLVLAHADEETAARAARLLAAPPPA
jgi:hypothetical protein